MSFYLQKHLGLRFHVEYNLSWQRFHVWLQRALGDGSTPRLVKPFQLELVPEQPDGEATPPTLELTHPEVQALLDSLWDAGVRPTDWGKLPTDVAGVKDEVIRAMQAHINDLRVVGREHISDLRVIGLGRVEIDERPSEN